MTLGKCEGLKWIDSPGGKRSYKIKIKMGDQALTTLLNMGFGYEESAAALENCKKDVNEAVAYLTDPSRAVVPFGPENRGAQPMDIEDSFEEEEFPSQGYFIIYLQYLQNLYFDHLFLQF